MTDAKIGRPRTKPQTDLLRTWLPSAEKIRAVAKYLRVPIVNVIDDAINLYYDKIMSLERSSPGMIIVDNDFVITVNNETLEVVKVDKGALTLYNTILENPTFTFFDFRTPSIKPDECVDVGELSK